MIQVVVPLLAVACVTALSCMTIAFFFRLRVGIGSVGLLVAFALVGAVVGMFAGLSNSPIAGGVVSGVITLLGAVGGYFFSKDTDKSYAGHIPAVIVVFSVALAANAIYNATLRARSDIFAKELDLHVEYSKTVQFPTIKKQLDKMVNAGELNEAFLQDFWGEEMTPPLTLSASPCD